MSKATKQRRKNYHEMKTPQEIIVELATEQECMLLRMRDSLENRRIKTSESKSFQYESAKLIGMIDIMDALKIDREEFNWIFCY